MCFVLLSLSAALTKSPTADENFHLVAGYSYLRWGDYRINPEHPPLAKIVAALPLTILTIDDSPLIRSERDRVQENGQVGWQLANRWLFSKNDGEKLFFASRLPMVGIGLLLGFVIFAWSRELYGIFGAMVSFAFFTLDPNFLAHATIIHTDVPFAFIFFTGTYLFWRALNQITWTNWLGSIVFFSLAAITKYSFIAIVPVWLALALVKIVAREPMQLHLTSVRNLNGYYQKSLWTTIILLSGAILAYLTIWCAYGFRYDSVDGQIIPLAIGDHVKIAHWVLPFVEVVKEYHLLPESWLTGFTFAFSTFNRTAYLLGEVSGNGFWLYFPIAFATKTPLATLIFLLLAFVLLLVDRNWQPHAHVLFVPVLLFFLLAVYSRMNIGLRHIIAIYPFIFVFLGGAAARLYTARLRLIKFLPHVAIAGLAVSVLNSYPNFLAYFNESVDQRERHEILVDSNLDWGQDLKGLKQWMVDHSVKRINLAYFGTADPAFYGIDAVHLRGTWTTVMSKPKSLQRISDPYFAISATHLKGLYFGDKNPYTPFHTMRPVATSGGTIMVYRLEG